MRALIVSFGTAFLFGAGPVRQPVSAPPTVVLLVRHAEKAAQPAQNPPLTEAGAARAHSLRSPDAGVTAIITTQYERTRKTAEPTALAMRVTPEAVDAGPVAQHANRCRPGSQARGWHRARSRPQQHHPGHRWRAWRTAAAGSLRQRVRPAVRGRDRRHRSAATDPFALWGAERR